MIAVNPGRNAHWGICTTVWGTPDLRDLPRKPNLAVVAVNNPDGLKLIELARAGATATLMCETTEGWFRSPIPVVTITGTEEPDPFVLLHGHYDSWDFGIGDNAVGNATLLEVARVLWKHRDSLKRSVRIAWWPGHSTGRYAGRPGSRPLRHRVVRELYRPDQLRLSRLPMGYGVQEHSWMDETEAFAQEARA
jgi:hypothetical protein